ncbi:MAG: helix-turn-helix domain-containing protein [Thermoflexales bacterium]|nr:helix-turn-helix domain-containing protein [Thermoflexales bacterium]
MSLSLRIGDLRKAKQDVGFFLFVLFSVVIVSALANVAEGFRVAQGERLTLTSVQKLDALQAVIGLSATGLMSLIVLALSEIIGTDVNTVIQSAEREHIGAIGVQSKAFGASNLNTAPEQDANNKAERLDKLLGIYRDDPGVGVSEAARRLGIGRTTVYAYLSELEQAGHIRRNGDGIQVMQARTPGQQEGQSDE